MSFNKKVSLLFSSLFFLLCSAATVHAVEEGLYAGVTNEDMSFWFYVNKNNGIDHYHLPYHVYDDTGEYLYTSGTTSVFYSATVFATINPDNTFEYYLNYSSTERRFTGIFSGLSVTGTFYWDNNPEWYDDPEQTSDTLTYVGAKAIPGIQITQQPVNTTVSEGSTASFSVSATFTSGNSSFQWYKNDVRLSGMRYATLDITDVQLADDGAIYYCYLYSYQDGLLVSDEATLTVTAAPLKGDIDSSGTLTLADAIIALQVVADAVPVEQNLNPTATIVPTDGIGVAEAIYTLNILAE